MSDNDPTLGRLEDQIKWYEARSKSNQYKFKILKGIVIICAALIPFLSAVHAPEMAVGGLGIAIAVIEGVQQMNQYHSNWITYRFTAEALEHEKYLFLATAGPYAATENPRALLAERIESLVSQEHAKWASGQEGMEQRKKSG
jgi:Protein of unknown function (DUF4231)